MTHEERAYWVALTHVSGIGSVTFTKLVTSFGSAQAVWHAAVDELTGAGLPQAVCDELEKFRTTTDPHSLLTSIERSAITVVTRQDADYPTRLQEIYDPPPVLYCKGRVIANEERIIAVVGSRQMTSYGKQATELLVTSLVAEGFTIVSGLAYGVDACAHQAALAANGRTIAVLGSGLWHIYPPQHTSLAEAIWTGQGAVISEVPPSMPAAKGNFPARNRIISGTSIGVLVTEAAKQSGTMITVAQALDQNRDIFAVPGHITAPLSVGTMKLIKQGARLTTCVDDILEELSLASRRKTITSQNDTIPTPTERAIYEALEHEPQEIDFIVRQTNLSTATVLSTLALLQLQGKVVALEPGVWQLKG